MENTSLILSLIKEDLRCSKLVLGLSSLGLDAGRYHTELSNIVFSLMELDHHNDALLGLYFDRIDAVTALEDVEDQQQLARMALDIYQLLHASKEKHEK